MVKWDYLPLHKMLGQKVISLPFKTNYIAQRITTLIIKTQNRNVLQNSPRKDVKLHLPITCQSHLSAVLQCLILKIIKFRSSANNTNENCSADRPVCLMHGAKCY